MSQRVFGERYEVISRLGQGGMASVYRAKDLRLLREVAVKLLQADTADEEGLFYFHREARAIAALRHPNIVQIYDYSGPRQSPAFIVMELIEGGNIDQMLMLKHPLPEDIIASAAFCVASALQHAHEQGVIHRDIKPANVMVENSGRLLLTDFGIAKAYNDEAKLGHTVSGQQTQLFGTPDFMAPEQILEKALGPHTDVFSLGSLIYCMATNVSPFDHEDTVEILKRVVEVSYIPLRQVRPELSEKLSNIIHSCLQLNGDDRPTSGEVAEMCEDLLLDHRVSNPQRNLLYFLQGKRAPGSKPRPVSQGLPRRDSEPASGRGRSHTDPEPAPITPHNDGWGDQTTQAALSWEGEDSAAGKTEIWTGGVPTDEPPGEVRPSQPGARRQTGQRQSPVPGEKPRSLMPWIIGTTLLGLMILTVAVAVAVKKGLVPVGNSTTTTRLQEVTPSTPSAPTQQEQQQSPPVTPTPSTESLIDAQELQPQGDRPSQELSTSSLVAGELEPSAESREDPERDARRKAAKKKVRSERAANERASNNTAPPNGNPKKGKRTEGKVLITVRPWGTVAIDGQRKGNTPVVRELSLPAGRHTFEFTHPSLGSQQRVVVVRPGDTVEVTVDLRKQ